jgi:hypothetical protein
MSDSLMTLPAPNEAAVVERLAEASRELIPGMQISLARRIVRPGSDQVLCLNATTSVPMQDDEIASVSDLALKLSDGTNVRISLSFFNDGNECPSFNHNQTNTAQQFHGQGFSGRRTYYAYDPERYSMHSVKNDASNHSNITSAMLVASAVAVMGLCASLNGPASWVALWAKLKQTTSYSQPVKPLEPLEPVEAIKAKASEHASSAPVAVNVGKSQSAVTGTAHLKATKSTQIVSAPAPKVAPKSHHNSARMGNFAAPPNMMVPPPPVTYTISPAQLFSPAEIEAMQPAPAAAKTSINSATRASKISVPQATVMPERPKAKAKVVSSMPEFDDENTVLPNAGLDLSQPEQGEQGAR